MLKLWNVFSDLIAFRSIFWTLLRVKTSFLTRVHCTTAKMPRSEIFHFSDSLNSLREMRFNSHIGKFWETHKISTFFLMFNLIFHELNLISAKLKFVHAPLASYYRPQTKLRKGYVFTRVCDSVHRGRVVSQRVLQVSGWAGGIGGSVQGDIQAHTQEGCVSQHVLRQIPPQLTATATGGTHPTGMHSCFVTVYGSFWIYVKINKYHKLTFYL